jgi:hypothetical protein
MFSHRPRLDRLEQTLTVGRPPVALISRALSRFAGPWQLCQARWLVLDGQRVRYRLELIWRSDVRQVWGLRGDAELPEGGGFYVPGGARLVRLYDDMSRLDRLRLWLLSVESRLRHLLGSA